MKQTWIYFREDLYHRLSVIVIKVPSLNERESDIPLLANYFIDKICKDHGMAPKTFDSNALAALKQVDWTGNIRELRNIVERLIILCDTVITADDVKTYVVK